MINPTDVAEAIAERLRNAAALAGVNVARDHYLNEDPGATPWVGVYRLGLDVDPLVLGRGGNSWRGTLRVDVACQYSSAGSGEKTGEGLDDLVKRVLEALFADKTFGGYVAATMSYRVTYDYQQKASATMDFQMATVSLTMEVRTN